ncbi:kinase-like protein [Ceraceosorus bombacis]|uniref:dual-specificity kinase n=1 Tax=Ceraceosorus bombacis TaxID=401625 RepID=A0A0P1BCV8_9BASI|nr:kinase-like protein [Ceraceosorus bombacis]
MSSYHSAAHEQYASSNSRIPSPSTRASTSVVRSRPSNESVQSQTGRTPRGANSALPSRHEPPSSPRNVTSGTTNASRLKDTLLGSRGNGDRSVSYSVGGAPSVDDGTLSSSARRSVSSSVGIPSSASTRAGQAGLASSTMGPPAARPTRVTASASGGGALSPSGFRSRGDANGTTPTTSRKPNLHLNFNESPQPASRFSNFSSVEGTPDGSKALKLSDRKGSISGASTGGPRLTSSSSPASSGPPSAASTPALELAQNQTMSGLGIGLPSARSSRSGVGPAAASARPQQTPQRGKAGSGPLSPSLPSASSTRSISYDRAGQVGIGELATPRWNVGSSSAQWASKPRRVDESISSPAADRQLRSGQASIVGSGASTGSFARQQSGTSTKSGAVGGRAAPTPATAISGSKTERTAREAEASRHSRAISYSASNPVKREKNLLRVSPEPTGSGESMLKASPSMPLYVPPLGGQTSLATLARGYPPGEDGSGAGLDAEDAGESPTFSINALSESESDAMHGDDTNDFLLSPRKFAQDARPSPRIGDLVWSEDENGPFGWGGAGDDNSRSPGRVMSLAPGVRRGTALERHLAQLDDESVNGSFDLNAAIADLLKEDEERRKRRSGAAGDVAAGTDTSPSTSRPTSMEASATVPSKRTSQTSTARSTVSRQTPDGAAKSSRRSSTRAISSRPSTATSAQPSSGAASITSRDTRRTRGPLSPPHSGGSSRQPTTSSGNSGERTRPSVPSGTIGSSGNASHATAAMKRASSASIGHSLLRGSMPLGAAEEFELSFDSGQGEDSAAEALRKLDGLGGGGTPRSSRDASRHRDASRSPRTSKQYSRPGSAGRRTPGGAASRPASPNRTATGTLTPRNDRQREESRSSNTARTSRNLAAKSRSGEERASPSAASVESPRSAVFPSPRTRRAQLPPLPNVDTTLENRRTSQTSVASRDTKYSASDRKRMSDASVHSDLQQQSQGGGARQQPRQTGQGAGNALHRGAADEEDRSRNGVSVPPVPPLPKGWESRSRAGSTGTGDGPPVSGSALVSHALSAHAPHTSSADAASPVRSPKEKAPSRKWSFSNLAGSFSRSPSVLKKSAESQAQASPIVSRRPSVTANTFVSTDAESEKAPRPSFADSQKTPNSPAVQSITSERSGKSSSNDDAVARLRDGKTSMRSNKAAARKAGEGAGSESSSVEKRTGSDLQLDSSTRESRDEKRSGDSHAPSANSGRMSRTRSILGLGSLLRGKGSRQSIVQTNGTTDRQHGPISVDNSFESSQAADASPRTSKFRPSNIMGSARKRGMTLPSSADPPAVEAATLPPMQVAPLQSPVSSTASPRKTSVSGRSHDALMSPRRALANSNSAGDLSASAARQRERAAAAGKGATLGANDPAAGAGSRDSQLSPSRPLASRIPRALASLKSTPSRSQLGTRPLGSSTSSQINRRVSTSGAAGLPKSVTTSSLASSMGIGSEEDAISIISASDVGDATATRRKSLSGAKSSETYGAAGGNAAAGASSTSLVSILNSYAAAKTPAELEVVMRRARVASYSSALSASEREVLNSLVSRQEQRKAAGNSSSYDGTTPSVATPRGSLKPGEAHSTRRAVTQSTSSTVLPSAAVSANSAQSNTAPRKVRASLTAASTSARQARDSALAPRSVPRQSAVATSASAPRASPAYSDRTSRTASVSPRVDEEELQGDAEMEAYIKRQHAKKIADGSSLEELEKMLRFPDPVPPSRAYSPRQAEAVWGDKLSAYEMQEMYDYKEIYFVGSNPAKKPAVPSKSDCNYGYDDERGDYLVVNRDHLAYRYEIMDLLGRGSFGQVLQCKDHRTGKFVAIKLIRNKKRFHHQALVEVKILKNLTEWDPDEQYNVIKMTESFYFRNHLCIAMELLSINLYELIKANSFAGFSTRLIRRFTSQVLASLSLMRHHRVVHCDLKPENILLRHPRKSGIKVIDFGSSCFEQEKVYTYIQSRFYRSPEVILGMNYNTAIDIWSLGCIIAELYTGYPLFPGENEQEQLACIMEILGVPDKYLIERSSRKKLFFDSTGAPRPVVNSKGKRRRPGTKTLAQVLRTNDDSFVDFLAKCLHWDPERRLKPDPAMRHPFLRPFTNAPAIGPIPQHGRQASLSNGGARRSVGNATTSGPGTTRTTKLSMTSSASTTAARGATLTASNSKRTSAGGDMAASPMYRSQQQTVS